MCDKAILWNGFVICNEIEDIIFINVNIDHVLQSFDFGQSTLDNETQIIFDNPIQVPADKLCRIDIKYRFNDIERGFKIKKKRSSK